MAKTHNCKQKICMCAEVAELTHLYCELKSQRKIATKINNAFANIEFPMNELDVSACGSGLETLRRQRKSVKELMQVLRDTSKELAEDEEEICQTDREIADLQDELRAIEKKSDRRNCCADVTPRKNERIETDDEASWRESTTLEIHERDRLQASISEYISHRTCGSSLHKSYTCQSWERINRMTQCLDILRSKRKSDEAKLQEDRIIDAKLLLDAINYVAKCTTNSALFISNNK
ncbi:hypothetical protein TSAR_005292 [Trichomalopsis sarcophagae]|uniref:Uncharacterized protein n=1 Tax=Trichomalopsis sarcophagae TaxID=543379 RepID=A0A232ESN8_9HYME|nr:hypothetical protein TSAR_005292 [Trichomalopsis sarcophagae]